MIDWRMLALFGIGVLVAAAIANDPRLNPKLRLVARYAEGDLVQDLETGLLHLV